MNECRTQTHRKVLTDSFADLCGKLFSKLVRPKG
jgi:hypothetical protein